MPRGKYNVRKHMDKMNPTAPVPRLDPHAQVPYGPKEGERTAQPPDVWRHRSSLMACRSCMWFSLKMGEVGRCRARPPSPDTTKGWPVVLKSDWCGSHKLDENYYDNR